MLTDHPLISVLGRGGEAASAGLNTQGCCADTDCLLSARVLDAGKRLTGSPAMCTLSLPGVEESFAKLVSHRNRRTDIYFCSPQLHRHLHLGLCLSPSCRYCGFEMAMPCWAFNKWRPLTTSRELLYVSSRASCFLFCKMPKQVLANFLI